MKKENQIEDEADYHTELDLFEALFSWVCMRPYSAVFPTYMLVWKLKYTHRIFEYSSSVCVHACIFNSWKNLHVDILEDEFVNTKNSGRFP